jgi:hypothetical protein
MKFGTHPRPAAQQPQSTREAAAFLEGGGMNANAPQGGWIVAYLEWLDGEERAGEAPGPAAAEAAAAEACSCEETAAAYLEWIAAPSFGRRATDRVGRATWAGDVVGLEAHREAMLLKALETEADCLHLLRRVVDEGDAPSPPVKLIVEALADADRLCQDEQRAWAALAMLQRSQLAAPRAEGGFYLAGSWPRALESVALDVRALAAKVLALQLH